MIINNGGGGVKADAKVNPDNALKTYGVTKSEARKAAIDGNSYNISTGLIAYTGDADEGLLYFKNDEVASVLVETITFGVGLVSATIADTMVFSIIRNPTTGTLISAASAATVSNRDFGSSTTLASTTLSYKGADGSTVTDGTVFGVFYAAAGGGITITETNIVVPRGQSFAIKVDSNTSGGMNVYASAAIHLLEDNLTT
jgi:hypothetical protein